MPIRRMFMINRVLIQFTSAGDVPVLSRFITSLKKMYPDMDIDGLYVKNMDEYLRFNSALYSEAYYQDFMASWRDVEEKKEQEIRDAVEEYFPGMVLVIRDGYSEEIVISEMRVYDLLVLAKSNYLTRDLKALLTIHHKPIIIVPEKESYSLEKVLFADDERAVSNRAFFSFLTLFDSIKSFKALGVNIRKETFRDLNPYLEKAGKSINYHFQEGHADELILEYSRNFDCLIMGDLKHSFLVERIGGKDGLKILEKAEIPIFIG